MITNFQSIPAAREPFGNNANEWKWTSQWLRQQIGRCVMKTSGKKKRKLISLGSFFFSLSHTHTHTANTLHRKERRMIHPAADWTGQRGSKRFYILALLFFNKQKFIFFPLFFTSTLQLNGPVVVIEQLLQRGRKQRKRGLSESAYTHTHTHTHNHTHNHTHTTTHTPHTNLFRADRTTRSSATSQAATRAAMSRPHKDKVPVSTSASLATSYFFIFLCVTFPLFFSYFLIVFSPSPIFYV